MLVCLGQWQPDDDRTSGSSFNRLYVAPLAATLLLYTDLLFVRSFEQTPVTYYFKAARMALLRSSSSLPLTFPAALSFTLNASTLDHPNRVAKGTVGVL